MKIQKNIGIRKEDIQRKVDELIKHIERILQKKHKNYDSDIMHKLEKYEKKFKNKELQEKIIEYFSQEEAKKIINQFLKLTKKIKLKKEKYWNILCGY